MLNFSPSCVGGKRILRFSKPALILCILRRSLQFAISRLTRFSFSTWPDFELSETLLLQRNTKTLDAKRWKYGRIRGEWMWGKCTWHDTWHAKNGHMQDGVPCAQTYRRCFMPDSSEYSEKARLLSINSTLWDMNVSSKQTWEMMTTHEKRAQGQKTKRRRVHDRNHTTDRS